MPATPLAPRNTGAAVATGPTVAANPAPNGSRLAPPSATAPRPHPIVYDKRADGRLPVNKSFQDWLSEGEQLYATAAHEYQELEQQIVALEQQLAAKRSEVNQIASVIGKPPIEGARRIAAQLLEEPVPQSTVPLGAIGRALSGRGGMR